MGGGLLGAKPERAKTCIYAHARQLLAAIVSPLVVVTRHHPLLLRECVLSGTANYGAARTVVYILFPILTPGGASKPRRGAARFSSFAPPVKPCDLFAERREAAQFSSFGPADGARIFLRRPARHPL